MQALDLSVGSSLLGVMEIGMYLPFVQSQAGTDDA